jgi:molybdate transport system substrate-binding protein
MSGTAISYEGSMRTIKEAALILALGFALAFTATSASAAEINVMSAVAIKSALEELIAPFEAETGHKLTVIYGTAGAVLGRIQKGEPLDVAILPRPPLDELVQQSRAPENGLVRLLSSAVGVAVREGAQKPDISSSDALKRTLLAAKSIAYSDPSRGAISSLHLMKVLHQLGITEEVKAKTIHGLAPALVARGEAEIGVTMVPEILPVRGVILLGPLPEELQSTTDFVYFGVVVAGAKEPEAGRTLLQFLAGSKGAAVFKAKGLSPG